MTPKHPHNLTPSDMCVPVFREETAQPSRLASLICCKNVTSFWCHELPAWFQSKQPWLCHKCLFCNLQNNTKAINLHGETENDGALLLHPDTLRQTRHEKHIFAKKALKGPSRGMYLMHFVFRPLVPQDKHVSLEMQGGLREPLNNLLNLFCNQHWPWMDISRLVRPK